MNVPVPSKDDEERIAAKMKSEHGHESRRDGELWDLDHSPLWPGIVKDFHWQLLQAGGRRLLPLPTDTAYPEKWIRALTKLGRVALRRGNAKDLAAMWQAHIGVTASNGTEEILHDGISHPDLLQVVLEWKQLMAMEHMSEGRGPIPTPPNVRAFVELQLTMALYETVIRDGLVFTRCLADAAAGKRTSFWDAMMRNHARVPYVDVVIRETTAALRGVGRVHGYTRKERNALSAMMTVLGKDGVWPQKANIGMLRDIVAHGKYSIDAIGTTHLDTYEHWVSNKFQVTTPGRIGYRTHPFRYRSITQRATSNMLANACSLAIVFWASQRDFMYKLGGSVKTQDVTTPKATMLADAEAMLIKVDPVLKEKEVEKEMRRMQRLRRMVKTKTTIIRVRSDPSVKDKA